MIAPVFEALSNDAKYNGIVFLKVDVDEAEDIAQSCNISAMPTFQFYRNGSKVEELVGANKDKIVGLLNTLLA